MSSETARELRQPIEAYDRCWLEGRPQDLRQFLHPDVVFTGPQFQRLAVGIDACVKSYEDFIAQAKVHAFKTSDYVIDVAEQAAVITYCWMVDYEIAQKRYSEIGRELLVLVRRADRWLVAWRTQHSESAPVVS